MPPAPEPPRIEPAAPPPAGLGVQYHAPPWTIAPASGNGPNGEDEVCYATYYNVADQIPDEYKIAVPRLLGRPDEDLLLLQQARS